jgi:hypothetical protein
MGWAGGSDLFNDISSKILEIDDLSYEQQLEIFKVIIECMEYHDWDTIDEVIGINPIVDDAVKKLYPDMFEEEY